MKWEKVKEMVGRGVYTKIIEGRDWETMAAILTDSMTGQAPVKSRRHDKLWPLYADKAWEIIQNWDIRCVGKLRSLFPEFFPKSLSKGDLVCDYDADGDWAVFVKAA